MARWYPKWFVEPLGILLMHRRLKVQEQAVLVLRDVGPECAPVRDKLLAALNVQGGLVRLAAIEALAASKPTKAVIARFEELWHASPSKATRHVLIRAFATLGMAPPEDNPS
jgi:hypothetical protein